MKKKNPLDFVVAVIGIFLMVVRFRGGAEFMSYIGMLCILIGLLTPPRKDGESRRGFPMLSFLIGAIVFTVWIFVEVCVI